MNGNFSKKTKLKNIKDKKRAKMLLKLGEERLKKDLDIK